MQGAFTMHIFKKVINVSAAYDGAIRISTKIDTKGVKTGLASLTSSLKSFAATVGAAFGVAKLVQFGKESSKTAMTAQANMQRVVDIFGEAKKSISSFVAQNAKDLGLSRAAANQYAATYGNLFSTYTSSQKENAALTQQYLQATAVVASKTGRTVADVAERIRSGLLGNTEAIEDLGINVNIKTIEITEAFKRIADGRSWEKLSAIEQAQVRQLAILEQATKKYGTTVANNAVFATQQATAAMENFKQSVGTVLNVAIVPAINLFTKLVNVADQLVRALFGKQIAQQEELASTAEQAAASTDKMAESTTKAAKAAKDATTGIDELNIVSKDTGTGTTGANTSPISTAGDAVSGTVGDKLEISPNIQKIADKIKEIFNGVKKALSDFGPLLKGIAAGLATAFAFKWLDKLVKAIGLTKLFAGGIGFLDDAILAGTYGFAKYGKLSTAFSLGLQSLWKSLKTFMKGLSPMAKVGVTIAGLAAVFVTSSNAVKKFTLGTTDLKTMLLNVIPVAGLVGVALTAMLGPVGAVITALGLAAGAAKGFNDAQNELQREFFNETFFDGAGIGLETFTDYLLDGNDASSRMRQGIIELGDTLDSSQEKILDASDQVTNFRDRMSINGGKLSKEDIPKFTTAFDTLKENVKNNMNAAIEIVEKTFRDGVTKAALKVGEDVDGVSHKLLEFQQLFDKETSDLDKQLQPYFDRINKGVALTPEEQKVFEGLIKQYTDLGASVSKSTTKFKDSISQISKIDFGKNSEEAANAISKIGDQGKALQDELEDAKITSLNAIETLQLRMNNMDLSPKARSYWTSFFKQLGDSAVSEYDVSKKDIDNQLSSVLGAIELNLDKQLGELADRTNATFGDRLNAAWRLGKFNDNLDKVMKDKVENEIGKPIRDELSKAASSLGVTANKTLGAELMNGLSKGISDNTSKATGAVKGVASSMEKTFRDATDTHSPSKVYQSLGSYLMEGLGKGILGSKQLVIDSFRSVLNALLDKVDVFHTRFRNAVNGLLSGMSTSMNGMKVGTDGKISFIAMPKLNIPRLAAGAIIPPNREFIATLGDQKNGRNIETPEALLRQIFREEGSTEAIIEMLQKLLDAIKSQNLDIRLISNDREIARSSNRGNKSLGYVVAAT